MIIKNFSNEKVEKNKYLPSIFLAGPTMRNSVFEESWRYYACNYLEEIGFGGIVYIPEYYKEKFDCNRIEQQCLWEREALQIANCILFWIPRNLEENMPAFTTNVEFGTYLQIKPNQIIYGRPNEAQKMRYLDWLYKYEKGPDANIYTTLEESLIKSVDIAEWVLKKNDIF